MKEWVEVTSVLNILKVRIDSFLVNVSEALLHFPLKVLELIIEVERIDVDIIGVERGLRGSEPFAVLVPQRIEVKVADRALGLLVLSDLTVYQVEAVLS